MTQELVVNVVIGIGAIKINECEDHNASIALKIDYRDLSGDSL